MTWEIFLGIVALVGFIITLMTPLMKLTKTMAELNGNVKALSSSLEALNIKNTESHRRMWDHNEKQDDTLDNHETRITKIETKIDIMHPAER